MESYNQLRELVGKKKHARDKIECKGVKNAKKGCKKDISGGTDLESNTLVTHSPKVPASVSRATAEEASELSKAKTNGGRSMTETSVILKNSPMESSCEWEEPR
jgi:hypothetical protein